ncbi:hypothetical protein F5884DRAFT_833084 [Xylogone sp. PMI_703]|nr:hypothetical protein F5884DRAFT_833084 [Xylogone sp. PMI_703]
MEALGEAIYATDAIHTRIHQEIKHSDHKVQNGAEEKESEKARQMAVASLDTVITFVQSALVKLRTSKQPLRTPAKTDGRSEQCPSVLIRTKQNLPPVALEFLKAVSADEKDGLGKQKKSLKEMATAVGPIMDNFDEILSKPYLDQHSAQLNTVPVLGLKDSTQIMYLAIQPDAGSGSGISEVWKPFGPLPDNSSASDPSQVHFFPYKGSIYVSIGRSVWRKTARTEGDPILKEAVNDFSKMYVNDWTKVGGSALPEADLKSVIPFAKLTSNGNIMQFHLLILDKNGTIKVLTNDDIYPDNKWEALAYSGSGESPQWARIAYLNEKVIALDTESNIWDLTVNFEQRTYRAADKTSINKVTEFTATDTGLVVVREDGYVYRRQVQSPKEGTTEPTTEWKRSIARNDVTRLGPASPGVMLNLNALTRVLKSRYIDAQKAVHPVMLKMKTFSRSYGVHIKRVLKAQKEYVDAHDDREKQEIALSSAEEQIENAIVWATQLNTILGNTKEEVNAMSRQLREVRDDLIDQLEISEDRLTGLRRTLDAQKETMSKLKAAFWGMVAGALFGLALGVIGLFMGANPTILKAAGALFVGSVVAAISLGQQIAELAGAIAQTEAEIRVTEQAITELRSVVQNFTSLDTLYGDMNQFWGRLEDTAEEVEALSETILGQIAIERFKDPSNIEAAQEAAEEIRDASDEYLDVLARQGIELPGLRAASVTFGSLVQASPTSFYRLGAQQFDAVWHQEVEKGIQFLMVNDHPGYIRQMRNAHAITLLAATASDRQRIRRNGWYNISELAANSTMFLLPQRSTMGEDREYEQLVSKVKVAARVTVTQLNAVATICDCIKQLLDQWENDQRTRRADDPLLQRALDLCDEATIHARQAHNGFADINNVARSYQQSAERDIRRLEDKIQVARARADQEIANLRYPGWPAHPDPETWMLLARSQIEMRFNVERWQIDQEIKPFRERQQSGATLEREALTWTKMAETVNLSTSGVWESLQMVKDWIDIDPEYYKDLLNEDWDSIERDTATVLAILGQYNVAAARAATSSAMTNGPDHSCICLTNQACKVEALLAEIGGPMYQASLAGIVCCWDPEYARPLTVREALAQVRSSLTEMQIFQKRCKRALELMGPRQQYATQNVLRRAMSLVELVEDNQRALLPIQQMAKAMFALWQPLAIKSQTTVELARLHMSNVEQRFRELEASPDYEKQDAKKQAVIVKLVADIIVITTDSPAQLKSTRAMVHISAALARARAARSSPKQTSSSLRSILTILPARDLGEVISRLTGHLKYSMVAAIETLMRVNQLLTSVGEAATSLETASTSMAGCLNMLLEDGNTLLQNKLDEKDVEQIMQSWVIT